MRKGALLIFALAASLWAQAAYAVTLAGEVVGVADGDTLTLLTADKVQHRIRLDGIDAPERTQPYSQVAKQSLADMVHRKKVMAECPKKDRFGRAVCKVYVDGQDVGLTQLRHTASAAKQRIARRRNEVKRCTTAYR